MELPYTTYLTLLIFVILSTCSRLIRHISLCSYLSTFQHGVALYDIYHFAHICHPFNMELPYTTYLTLLIFVILSTWSCLIRHISLCSYLSSFQHVVALYDISHFAHICHPFNMQSRYTTYISLCSYLSSFQHVVALYDIYHFAHICQPFNMELPYTTYLTLLIFVILSTCSRLIRHISLCSYLSTFQHGVALYDISHFAHICHPFNM